jgi:hypothetical protein
MLKTTKRTQARLRLVVDNERESAGGYKSGRNSWRGMPDAASSGSTRSAGTRPDLRHFCNDWYRTPSFSASGCSPPPASIARSTASMPPSLQLTGVIRQQPARVVALGSMQLVVANAKTKAEQAFAAELNKQLAQRDGPTRGRPAWLKKELKRRVKLDISLTTGQKWLGQGKLYQIPRGWKLKKLIEAFDLDVEPLMKAGDLLSEDDADEKLVALRKLWPRILDENDRDALLRMAYRSAGVPLPEAPPMTTHEKVAAKG